MVEEGSPAPDFTLPSDSGETITLSQFRGSPVVVYFYPKDESLWAWKGSNKARAIRGTGLT
jgi:peroxiredoxin